MIVGHLDPQFPKAIGRLRVTNIQAMVKTPPKGIAKWLRGVLITSYRLHIRIFDHGSWGYTGNIISQLSKSVQ